MVARRGQDSTGGSGQWLVASGQCLRLAAFFGEEQNRSNVPTGTFNFAEKFWGKLLIPRMGFW
jgi:hypothetical protein